jgi:hypothetical protein
LFIDAAFGRFLAFAFAGQRATRAVATDLIGGATNFFTGVNTQAVAAKLIGCALYAATWIGNTLAIEADVICRTFSSR